MKRGSKITYEHPNREAYGLNPKEWRILVGKSFYRVQISKNASEHIVKLPIPAAGFVIGAVIGTLLASNPVASALVGGLLNAILLATGNYFIEQYLRDEEGAIWLWLKKSDWDAVMDTLRDYETRTVEYLKLGDLPAFRFPLPAGNPQFGGA